MKERDEKRTHFTIRAMQGDNDLDIVAAVIVGKGGEGEVAADHRLTVPMLAILRRRHNLSATSRVVGGAFSLESDSFIRGGGGMTLEALKDSVSFPVAEMVLYTRGLLDAQAKELTLDARWDF